MKLGTFEIYALSDGSFSLDGGQMFGVVPKALWDKKLPADDHNRVRLGLTCLLVKTDEYNVLIETGIGDKFDAKFAEIYNVTHSSRLPDELLRRGLRVDDIDIVINTHLHFDHCGWNTRREGTKIVPTFPNARYFMQRAEWEHAMHPSERDRASYLEEWFAPAEPQSVFVEGSREIVPGVRVELAPGHVRDMQCVWIESEGQKVCFVSDLVPTRAHIPLPWIMAFDLYPMDTLTSKKQLLPRLAKDQVLVVFPHDADVPWGKLVEVEGKLAFQAVAAT
ncbi:MAG: MBL fold metallo-hydrolase [Acidobacteria bacterium]|nr:MAG: MBL fold metallo-hydrolase [Acidobacteriota bacterium]